MEDIHLVVPNPYILLTLLPGDLCWFTVLGLTDVFFCVPWSPKSQASFAFEWEDLGNKSKQQYCWTELQGLTPPAHVVQESAS